MRLLMCSIRSNVKLMKYIVTPIIVKYSQAKKFFPRWNWMPVLRDQWLKAAVKANILQAVKHF
jgi:hypothetical protein